MGRPREAKQDASGTGTYCGVSSCHLFGCSFEHFAREGGYVLFYSPSGVCPCTVQRIGLCTITREYYWTV